MQEITIQSIKSQLEKLKEEKDKLKFLEGKLKESKDSEVKLFILALIAELRTKDEDKPFNLDNDTISERELSRLVSGFEPEQPRVLTRIQQTSLDNTVSRIQMPQTEERQSNYANSNYINNHEYNPGARLSDYTSQTGNDFMVDLRDKFIREGVLQQNKEASLEQRESLRNRLRMTFPGISEESLIRYETDILGNTSNSFLYKKPA